MKTNDQKLTRNLTPDGKCKYAIVRLDRIRQRRGNERREIEDALQTLEIDGVLEYGEKGSREEFFVLKLKDVGTGYALERYAREMSYHHGLKQYSQEIEELAARSFSHPERRVPTTENPEPTPEQSTSARAKFWQFFHEAWGNSRAQTSYNKKFWQEFQAWAREIEPHDPAAMLEALSGTEPPAPNLIVGGAPVCGKCLKMHAVGAECPQPKREDEIAGVKFPSEMIETGGAEWQKRRAAEREAAERALDMLKNYSAFGRKARAEISEVIRKGYKIESPKPETPESYAEQIFDDLRERIASEIVKAVAHFQK